MRLVKAETVSLDLCDTCLYKHSFCGTKVASMDPKWDHMGLEKPPPLWMESVHEIFMRAGAPCGEIAVCLQSPCVLFDVHLFADKAMKWEHEVRARDRLWSWRSELRPCSPSCCLLPCPLCTLYLLFGFARLNAADVSSCYSSSLGGRGELLSLMRSRRG